MSYKVRWSAAVLMLNRLCWVVSVSIWLWIVIRSGIFSADFSDPFWPNFFLFFAAGAGVIATTHFVASALPLLLGVMVVSEAARDVKGNWALLNLYIVAAIAIGFFAILAHLSNLNSRRSESEL